MNCVHASVLYIATLLRDNGQAHVNWALIIIVRGNKMPIKYPISEDYATQSRQAFIRYQSRKVLLDEHETKLIDDDFESSSIGKVATVLILTTVILLSLYLFNTQAKANDGNVMPISPMRLVDHLGNE